MTRLHALWTEEGVRRFLFDGRMVTIEEARTFVAASEASFAEHGYGLWLVGARATGQFVGFVGLLPSASNPQILYALHPDHWGRGYATEAVGAVLQLAQDQLRVPGVWAEVDEPNVASARVLERLGMRQVARKVVNEQPLLCFELRNR